MDSEDVALKILGYTHCVANRSENFVDPSDRTIHTQKIERILRFLGVFWINYFYFPIGEKKRIHKKN